MTTVESLIDFGEVADSGADDHYDVLPPSGGHSNYDLLGEIDDSHRSFGDVGEDDEVEETYSEDDGGQDYLREGSPIQESNHVYERADDVQHFHEEADFVDVRNSEAADDKSSESDSDHSEASLPGDNLDEFDPLRSTMSETATTAKTTTTKTRRAKKVVSKKKAVSVSSRGSSTSDVSDGGEKKYEAQFGDTPEDVTVNGTEQDLNAQEDATYAYSADAVDNNEEVYYTREDDIAYADDSIDDSPQQQESQESSDSESEPEPVEEDASWPESVPNAAFRRQVEIDRKARPVSLVSLSADSRCRICDKRVYEMEKVIADEMLYHKTCFKCSHCKRVLSLGNFAAISGQLLCKPHFLELFKTKGNYEEGFGLERHMKQWGTPEPQSRTVSHTSVTEDEVDHSREHEMLRSVEVAKDVEDTKENIRSLRSKFLEQDTPVEKRASRTSRSSNSSQPETLEFHSNGIVAHVTVPDRKVSKSDEDQWEETMEEEEHQASTRCLVARFNSPTSDKLPPSPRKPIHKMTPPRQELARDIETALAAEKVREDVAVEVMQPAEENTEFPEYGITSLLVARWKTMEQEGSGSPLTPASTYRGGGTPSRKDRQHEMVTSPAPFVKVDAVDAAVEEDVRETRGELGQDEEEDSIAACHTTQSMLAKFKVMEKEAEREHVIYRPSPNRDFRWNVKEVKPLSRPNISSRSDSATYEDASKLEPLSYENNSEDDNDINDEVYTNGDTEEVEETHLVPDELPSPKHTRNILAKFRSMEDDAMLPPSPQRAVERRASQPRPQVAQTQPPVAYHEESLPPVANGHNDDDSYESEELMELPEEGTTRHLLAKFQAMQSQC